MTSKICSIFQLLTTRDPHLRATVASQPRAHRFLKPAAVSVRSFTSQKPPSATTTSSSPPSGNVSISNDQAPPKETLSVNPQQPTSATSGSVPVSGQHKSRGPARQNNDGMYDCVIVGGGVTGSALLYELANFTDMKKLALVERRAQYSLVASHPSNNSQTIHCGDIETNYKFDKAKAVKRQADMLRNFASKLEPSVRDKVMRQFPKMLLGVGSEENELLADRYETFKDLFPKMELLNKRQIREREPCVVMRNTYDERPESLNAIYIEGEHCAVNYEELTHAMLRAAEGCSDPKQVDLHPNTEVSSLQQLDDGTFKVFFRNDSKQAFRARSVVVSACGYSLMLAHKMGYGLNYSCLPVAGSFYYTDQVLNGKVYTVQDPALPFAAVHGDPDLTKGGKTRFGPTALPVPKLERDASSLSMDFLRVTQPSLQLLQFYLSQARDWKRVWFIGQNLKYQFGPASLFEQEAKKIVPSLRSANLEKAESQGGVRPQLVDVQLSKLIMGEGKIDPGTGVIFNITPSPGGTTCLGNAERDMRKICERTGAKIDEAKLSAALYNGDYPVTM